MEVIEDNPINAIKSPIVEEKEGLVGQHLIQKLTAGDLPQLQSASAQAALITIAEQLVSPTEVQKLVNEETHSGGSQDCMGIKSLDLALRHSTQTQEETREIVNNLETDKKELEKHLILSTNDDLPSKDSVVSLTKVSFILNSKQIYIRKQQNLYAMCLAFSLPNLQ